MRNIYFDFQLLIRLIFFFIFLTNFNWDLFGMNNRVFQASGLNGPIPLAIARLRKLTDLSVIIIILIKVYYIMKFLAIIFLIFIFMFEIFL